MPSTRMSRPAIAAFALCLLLTSGSAVESAPAVVKGAGILEHAIGKLALASMALQREGKFDEFLKLADREYNEHYAALSDDRKKRLAATMKQAALPAEKFRDNIRTLGELTIDGTHATLTTKETVDVGGGVKTSSGLEMRFSLEGGTWKVAP